MEIILLLIYSFFIWLIFFKFKWLPWNIVSQVIAFTLPVIGLAITILVLNVVAPSSADVRVTNYVVQVVSPVAGRVVDVPVEANRPVKKGDVLFRIDPVPYQQQVNVLEAKISELGAKLATAQAYDRELGQQLKAAQAQQRSIAAQLDLARKRKQQARELAASGAGSRFDAEQADAGFSSMTADLAATTATVAQITQKQSARTDGDLSEIVSARSAMAQLSAQIAEARWRLSQTTVRAPANGTVVNLQLREGSYAVSLPISPAMTFVEDEQWVLAMFSQNELANIKPGNEAEVALRTHPNQIIKCKVDSVVWSSGTGQLPTGGRVPDVGSLPLAEGRFAVRLRPTGRDADIFLPMGAQGQGAVYTDHVTLLHMIRRVMLRVATKLDWLVLKLH